MTKGFYLRSNAKRVHCVKNRVICQCRYVFYFTPSWCSDCYKLIHCLFFLLNALTTFKYFHFDRSPGTSNRF